MKTNKLLALLIMLTTTTLLLQSCNDSDPLIEPTETLDQNNQSSGNFLFNTSSARSRARLNGVGPIGLAIGSGNNGVFGRNEKNISPSLMMRSFLSQQQTFSRDSSDNYEGEEGDYDSELPDCAQESFNLNDDGTYEYSIDFGDGCDFFGETLKGRLTETGSYTENSFKGTTTYEGLGGESWEISGTYTYAGSFTGFDILNDADADTNDIDFSATFDYSFDLEEKYEEEDGPITVTSSGSGMEESDDNGITILAQTVDFSYSTGESFTSTVSTPLFTDFNCFEEDVFIYVSGEESGTYTFEGETNDYSINYGDGTCDNVITVTQNGMTETIDLGEEWDEFNDEDNLED